MASFQRNDNSGWDRSPRNNYYRDNNNGGGRGYAKNDRPYKKHSGFARKSGLTSEGKEYVVYHGWNYSRQSGLISVFIHPYKGSHESKSKKSGNTYVNMLCEVTVGKQQPYLTSALYCVETRKVTIPKMGWVGNYNAPNGGYLGKFTK